MIVPLHPDKEGEAGTSRPKTVAQKVLDLGLNGWDLGRSTVDGPFAIRRDGPFVASMFRGGHDSLRASLAAAYYETYSGVASSSALADALKVLEGMAAEQPAVELGLRVARDDSGRIVVDLGDDAGRAVVIDGTTVQLVERSPVLFRRTALTGALPQPAPGGDLEDLRQFVNVSDAYWPVLVAWMVAAFFADLPHPIALLTGEQGSGKTTTARFVCGLVDPGPAAIRSAPQDPAEWAVTASASWVVAMDNLSRVPEWFSDSLCRAVTGAADVRRALYTDGGLHILAVRRAIILTSIDVGALRGDLADRIVKVELQPIKPGTRTEEASIVAGYNRARPWLFGALLELVCEVMMLHPTIVLTDLGRMADFTTILAAVDQVLMTDGLSTYRAGEQDLTADLVDGDPVARAVREFADQHPVWRGSAADLLERITPEQPPKRWPSDATRLSGELRRLAPALRQVGIDVDSGRAKGRRWISIERAGGQPELFDSGTPSGTPGGSAAPVSGTQERGQARD